VYVCEQLARGRYIAVEWPAVELMTSRVTSQHLNNLNHQSEDYSMSNSAPITRVQTLNGQWA